MIKYMFKSINIILCNAFWGGFFKILQSVLVAIMTPLSIVITQRLVDSIERYHGGYIDYREVVLYAAFLFATLLIITGNGLLDNVLSVVLKRAVNNKLTFNIVQKFLKLKYKCFEDSDVADTIKRMGEAPQEKILDIFLVSLNIIAQLISIIGTALVFTQVSIWFSVAFFGILGPMLWIDYRAMTIMNTIFDEQSEKERRLSYCSGLLEDKNSLLELKISNAVKYILNKAKAINNEVLSERVKTTIRSHKYFAISTLFVIAWAAFVVMSLGSAASKEMISIGIFVALIGSAGTLLDLSQNLSRNFANLSRQCLNIRHYYNFLKLPEDNEVLSEIEIYNPRIEFDHVSFKYPKTDVTILKDVSFAIEQGQKVALVGENGAGKSTIIKLLCKLYKPDSGHIRVNGTDLQDIPMSDLKKIFGVAFQDYVCYALSLRENVALGDVDKINDDERIKLALKDGLADGLLEGLNNGLDSHLGKIEDDGVDLSGGQWQRVAISRACLPDGSLVVLDEPTASLDPIAESDMYNAFSSALKDKGCLIISHRLASARLADKIILLDSGVVAESGSHDELMAKRGLYCKMFENQSYWYA